MHKVRAGRSNYFSGVKAFYGFEWYVSYCQRNSYAGIRVALFWY